MEQKDNILEKISHAFHEKESIISQLKTKLHNSTFEKSLHSQSKNDMTAKRIFQKSPARKDSDSASERSLRSLAYLMQKTEMDKMRKTLGERVKKEISNRNDSEGLSHSHSESLSGSSTTSIVGRWYDKSWKQNYQHYEYMSEEDDFDREQIQNAQE